MCIGWRILTATRSSRILFVRGVYDLSSWSFCRFLVLVVYRFDCVVDEDVVVAGSRVGWRDSYDGNSLKWALQHDNGGDAS